jgi:poly(3-hydroxybutyrate) depolymerase
MIVCVEDKPTPTLPIPLQVLRGHGQRDTFLADYCDGTVHKNHALFSADILALEIMAYYDDVEVCNPLGSRAKKHKLGMYMICVFFEYYGANV